MIGPAVLIAHGPRGDQAAQRTAALAHPSEIVVEATPDTIGTVARELAGQVAGQTLINVVHFVDPEESGPDEVAAGMAAVHEAVTQLPAVYFRQSVVAMVGEDWDDDELALAMMVGPDKVGSGILTVGRSSEARGLLTPEDEVAMASDVGYALVCTGLGRDFDTSPQLTAGATTVIYRRRLLVAALAAYHAGAYLDDPLLAPVSAQQPFGRIGHLWAGVQELGTARHRELIARGHVGGSTLSDLAVSDRTFEDIPFELLSDALQSYFEQLASGMLHRVKKQIDRNQGAHLAATSDTLHRETTDTLRESLSFDATDDYLRNVEAGLAEIGQTLLVQVTEAEHRLPTRHDTILSELERAVRKLPFPAAIAARGAGFAALGMMLFLLLQKPMDWPDRATPAGLGVGAVAAGFLYCWYRLGIRHIKTLRRQYLRAIELRLRAEAELYVLQRILDEVNELRTLTGGGKDCLGERLNLLRRDVLDLRITYSQRVADRTWGALYSTDYSIFVPSAADVSTEALSRQFPLPVDTRLRDAIMRAILPGTELNRMDVAAADELIVDVVASQVEHFLWSSLADLLADAPATLERVIEVLSTPVSPLLRRSDFVAMEDEVRRFLLLGQGMEQTIFGYLGGAVDYDGPRPTDDRDLLSLLALRNAHVVTRRPGSQP